MESRPPDESTLVARARRGEAAAYEELVRMHQAIAFRVALVNAGDRADDDEAVQDGFVKAYRALGRFRDGAPFRPWLLKIVANEARNRRRSAGRRAGLTLRVAGTAASGDAAPSPRRPSSPGSGARSCSTQSRASTIATATSSSIASCRARRAGDRRGARDPSGTVKSRTSRALERLRAQVLEVGE